MCGMRVQMRAGFSVALRGAVKTTHVDLRPQIASPTHCSLDRLLQQALAANVRSLDAETLPRPLQGEAGAAESPA